MTTSTLCCVWRQRSSFLNRKVSSLGRSEENGKLKINTFQSVEFPYDNSQGQLHMTMSIHKKCAILGALFGHYDNAIHTPYEKKLSLSSRAEY